MPIKNKINIKSNIKNLLEEKVRPFIQMDGGDIEFVDYDEKEKTVKVKLQGACVGCSLADVTLKLGVEKEIIKNFPEVKRVITIN